MNKFKEWATENADEICRLVFANNGFEVNGWGFLSYQDGVQKGLEQEDALRLIQIEGRFDGACMALNYEQGATDTLYDWFYREHFTPWMDARFEREEEESGT